MSRAKAGAFSADKPGLSLFRRFFTFLLLMQLCIIATVSLMIWAGHRHDDPATHQGPKPPPRFSTDSAPPPPGTPDNFEALPYKTPPTPMHGPFPWIPLLVGVIGSFVSAYLLARYIAHPIAAIREAFAAVKSGALEQKLIAELEPYGSEMASLGRDFDKMTLQLSQLIQGNKQLLHDVSHELRSPLARLQLAIDIGQQQPERLQDAMTRIERESKRMDRLIGELLELSRIEVAQQHSDSCFSLNQMLADLVDDASFEAQARQIRVSFKSQDDTEIQGEPMLLRSACENILRNAIRHSEQGNLVHLQVRQNTQQQLTFIDVLDQGPGVAESELERMFNPFVRGKQSTGYGLGLAIAKRAVESLGGHISAQNRAKGGLKVRITLPSHHASTY